MQCSKLCEEICSELEHLPKVQHLQALSLAKGVKKNFPFPPSLKFVDFLADFSFSLSLFSYLHFSQFSAYFVLSCFVLNILFLSILLLCTNPCYIIPDTHLLLYNVLFTLNLTTHGNKTLLCVVQFNVNKTLQQQMCICFNETDVTFHFSFPLSFSKLRLKLHNQVCVFLFCLSTLQEYHITIRLCVHSNAVLILVTLRSLTRSSSQVFCFKKSSAQ